MTRTHLWTRVSERTRVDDDTSPSPPLAAHNTRRRARAAAAVIGRPPQARRLICHKKKEVRAPASMAPSDTTSGERRTQWVIYIRTQ